MGHCTQPNKKATMILLKPTPGVKPKWRKCRNRDKDVSNQDPTKRREEIPFEVSKPLGFEVSPMGLPSKTQCSGGRHDLAPCFCKFVGPLILVLLGNCALISSSFPQ